ncbi:tetrathionate reductase subunit B precursor [bacterium BMS3Abin07]|nr:tetrathionate reductase subunit B precursor [bacterium BMS3Abin07]GBE33443.1 tetrathionate reductase subunit B precursor [bacterium BMS3Bbin05]HDO22328.1 4Fe-4S dicluster domain-containing protein [Nitrospirota bacterium]HDZ88065.1 4Fe-4S dicluster domain-containing protein [Nitrospirota bacterium]
MKDGLRRSFSRRSFLKGTVAGLASIAIPVGSSDASIWEAFFQKHFREMNDDEKKAVINRLEEEYARKFNIKFNIKTTRAIPGTLFGYGLDLSRCIGCRRCVYACMRENNQSRDPQVQWITVLRFKKGEKWVNDLEEAEKYYYPEKVPEDGYFYMPVQCQHCENPPCVRACPTQATWKEPDGIVVVDYNWCIGCRYCMAACPYGARRFNWGTPHIRKSEINPETHYLGNRPRYRGIVEKCTFCIQRTRENPGRYPACVEICPVGARKFGNLLDPDSEIRYIIENERVFRLKEDENTNPKFYYFFAT